MIARFVHLAPSALQVPSFREQYGNRILPALAGTHGCLLACLAESSANPSLGISMTLWEKETDADAYEASGLYDVLLDETDTLVPGAPRAPLRDPEIETLPVLVAAGIEGLEERTGTFLRIVEILVEPGRTEELSRRYEEVIVPRLLALPGCRAILLADTRRPSPAVISVTFWDTEETAVRYEISGAFERLATEIREFFSGTYQWRLSLASGGARRDVEARDLAVQGFRLVVGRWLGG